MERMGWKEGLGLGKAHQGITTPLEHQKTDKRSGVIRAAEQIARLAEEGDEGPAEKKARGVSLQGNPSRVVLLRNIVGPGKLLPLLCSSLNKACSECGTPAVEPRSLRKCVLHNYWPDTAQRH